MVIATIQALVVFCVVLSVVIFITPFVAIGAEKWFTFVFDRFGY